MNGHLEEETRKRAFEIWEREGSGDPAAHWFQAERELAREAQEQSLCGSDKSLPDHWVAAIESAVQKLTRKAQVRVASPRRLGVSMAERPEGDPYGSRRPAKGR